MPLPLKDHSRHASFASDNKKQTVSLSFVRTKGKPSSVPRQPQIEPCLWCFLHSQNALWQKSFPSLQPLIKYPMGLFLRHRSGIWQQPPSDARLLNREGKISVSRWETMTGSGHNLSAAFYIDCYCEEVAAASQVFAGKMPPGNIVIDTVGRIDPWLSFIHKSYLELRKMLLSLNHGALPIPVHSSIFVLPQPLSSSITFSCLTLLH